MNYLGTERRVEEMCENGNIDDFLWMVTNKLASEKSNSEKILCVLVDSQLRNPTDPENVVLREPILNLLAARCMYLSDNTPDVFVDEHKRIMALLQLYTIRYKRAIKHEVPDFSDTVYGILRWYFSSEECEEFLNCY